MKKMLLFAALFGCFRLVSQDIDWEEMPSPSGGGSAQEVHQNQNGQLFYFHRPNTGYDSAGLYRSLDTTRTWQHVTTVPNGSQSFFWGNDGKIYAVTEANTPKKVWRSADGGQTFQLLTAASQLYFSLPPEKYLFSPTGALLTMSGTSLKRSTNWGETLTNTFNLLAFENITEGGFSIDPASGKFLASFSCTTANGGKYRYLLLSSADDGQTWQVIVDRVWSEFSSFRRSFNVGFDGTFFLSDSIPKNILRSTDGGLNWQSFQVIGSAYSIDFVTPLANGDVLCSANGSYNCRSTDKGQTWVPEPEISQTYHVNRKAFANGLLLSGGLNNLQANPTYSKNRSSLYLSMDGGHNWAFAANGIPFGAPLSVAFLTDMDVFAGTSDGLFRSTDGGKNWQLLEDIASRKNIFKVAIGPGGDVFYANLKSIYRRLGGGSLADSLPVQVADYYEVNPFDIGKNGHLFANTQISPGFISAAISEDNGMSWQQMGMQPQSSFGQIMDDADGNLLNSELQFSVDKGQTWAARPGLTGFANHFLAREPDGQIWSFCINVPVVNNVVLKSGDLFANFATVISGANVSSSPFYEISQAAINQLGHSFILIKTQNAIMRSTDGGLSYSYLPDLPSLGSASLSLAPDQRLWVTNSFGNLFRTKIPTTLATLIVGSARNDVDKNCSPTAPDPVLPSTIIAVKKGASGPTAYGTADAMGHFSVPADVGQFSVNAVPPSNYWESCSASASVSTADLGSTVGPVDVLLRPLQECPLLQVDIQPNFLSRCLPGSYSVFYKNLGTKAAPNASVEVILDPFLAFNSATIPVEAQLPGNILVFNLGTIGENEGGSFNIDFEVSCAASLGQYHCSEAKISPNKYCPAWTGGEIEARSECTAGGTQVRLFLKNIGQNAMNLPAKWSLFETDPMGLDTVVTSETGEFQLGVGQVFEKTRPNNGHLYTLLASQEADYPIFKEASATIRGCSEAFWMNDRLFSASSCKPNSGSFDPNEKTAEPDGIGPEHRIAPDQRLEYTIHFQNTGTGTAFNIFIRDTLSTLLDAASIEQGAASHPYSFALEGAGVAIFRFNAVNLPDSNVNWAGSNGFVKFAIRPRAGLGKDQVIANRAAIFFDLNEPVITKSVERKTGLPPINPLSNSVVSQVLMSIAPNPADDFFVVMLSEEGASRSIEILDVTGRLVSRQPVLGKRTVVDRHGLPNGLFQVRISNAAGAVIAVKKLVMY